MPRPHGLTALQERAAPELTGAGFGHSRAAKPLME